MLKRLFRSNPVLNFISWLIAGYFRLVYATSRFQHINRHLANAYFEQDSPRIIAFWHGRIALMPFGKPKQHRTHMLISLHGDGELIARVVARMGVEAVRGSTEKQGRVQDKGGAQALRIMAKILRDGHSVGITPDGPRGPRMRVSDGAILLARMTGIPIFPVVYATSWRKILGTWDRFHFPLPFSKGLYCYGDLIEVPRKGDAALYEAKRQELENSLNAMTAKVDKELGHPPITPEPIPNQTGPDQTASDQTAPKRGAATK